MREIPRKRVESSQEQYDKLLRRALEAQKEYSALQARITALYNADDEEAAEDLEAESEHLEDRMGALLDQRVELIRKTEHLRTIEDAFPRCKEADEDEGATAAAEGVHRLFTTGKAGIDALRAGRPLVSTSQEEPTRDEMIAWAKARAALAREYGYAVENEDPDVYFTIRTGSYEIRLKHFMFPSGQGITGYDRISAVSVIVTKGDTRQGYGVYHDGWDAGCDDRDAQKEIDRAIAIFG